jgi:hypothetical protein
MAASYEQYGISQDDVNNIPGYENLSEGQQIMALQNLGHLVLGRVEADAIQSYEREYRQGNFVTSFFRRFKMRWWREDYMDKHRQDAALLYKRDGGMNSDFLRNLVREFNNKGPEVIRETKGGRKILRVQWFNEKLITPEFDMAYPGTFNAVRNFNEAADKFAQVPRAWGQEGSTNDQAKWYEEYTKRYLRARDALMAKLDPHRTGLNQRLVDKVFEAGNLVEENQILHSHTGDADDEFKRIMNGR